MASEELKKTVRRVRAPRVEIEYEVEFYGAMRKVVLPFVIGVFAPLSGERPHPVAVADRKFLHFDIDNFDDRMRSMRPEVTLRIPEPSSPGADRDITLCFLSMSDFSPAAVARQVPALDLLLRTRTAINTLLASSDGKPEIRDFLLKLLQDADTLKELAKRWQKRSTSYTEVEEPESGNLADFFKHVTATFRIGAKQRGEIIREALELLANWSMQDPYFQVPFDDITPTLTGLIHDLDQRLTSQLNQVLHHPVFQAIEGTWRGLHYLVSSVSPGGAIKIRVMDVSKRDLQRTLKKFKGSAWNQSPIFKKLYEEEYGTLGGEPYGCLIGDYYFDHSPADVELLRELSQIAAATHSPFISSVAPSLLNMESWQELNRPRDLMKIFAAPDFAAWRSLRESDDSRYLGLTLPRVLARLPYGDRTEPVPEFQFTEDARGEYGNYVWLNAAFAFGRNIVRSFEMYGWCTSIRGIESGGALEGLPLHLFPDDDGGVQALCPTENAIDDRREAELTRCGLLPLLHRKNSDLAAFVGAASLHKPAEYTDAEASANAILGARLPYLFAVSRFMHYIKCMVRDKVGSFRDREELEKYLQDWLLGYVTVDPENFGMEARARKPLASAEIKVEEIEGRPGSFSARVWLRPQYLLEGISAAVRVNSRIEASVSR